MERNYKQSNVATTSKTNRQETKEVVSDTEYETDDDAENMVNKSLSSSSSTEDLVQPSTSTNTEDVLPKREKRTLQTEVVQNKKKRVDDEVKKKGVEDDTELGQNKNDIETEVVEENKKKMEDKNVEIANNEYYSPVCEINTQDFV